MADINTSFPRQKLARSRKTSTWAEDCIKASIHMTDLYNTTRRSPRYKKIRNYNLYNGKLDVEDLAYVTDPFGLKDSGKEFPANMQFYPIATPIFDVLIGEEIKRPFSFIVRAVNDTAISTKEKKKKEDIKATIEQTLARALEGDQTFEEFIQKELAEINQYEYHDMREHAATHTLNYLRKYLDLDRTFQRGWEDALIAGEEIYKVGIVAGEPSLVKCNPIEIHALLPHNNDTLDEAEVIVEETYMSPSAIVDYYYEELKPSQIDALERGDTYVQSESIAGTSSLPPRSEIGYIDGSSPISDTSHIYDPDGNILVRHVTWKSKKKVGELTYTDELGMEQSTMVDETYKKSPGEKVSWFWINEYWKGTLIGEDIFVDIGPKETQFRSMDNISKCKSGYIGTVYNANNSQSVSLMDRLVPWLYMYTVMWYRTELLIAANQGKIALIDLALIPDDWEVEKWLYYATATKFGFVNSFNESKHGQSTGMLANNAADRNKALDMETGQAIQGHVQLLEFIENKVKELAGTPDQRLGAISASEKVSNARGAIVQGSHITEKWFEVHNWTKQRALTALIEVAKEAWSENSKRLQYVTDTLGSVFFTVDNEEFNNADYGVFVSNSARDNEALQALKDLTHAAMQNEAVSLSSIAEIYASQSIGDIKAKLKVAEAEAEQRKQAQAQQANQIEQQKLQAETEQKKAELDKEYYKIDKDNETKITVAEINSFKFQEDQDSNDNGVPDQLELAKLKADIETKNKKLDLEARKLDQDKELQEKKMELEKKKIKQQNNKPKK